MDSVVKLIARASLMALAALPLALAGCGTGVLTHETSGWAILNGSVHGGIQPVTGASVQLYAVGTTGNGSAATPLFSSPAITDVQSNFTLTGTYSCPSAATQVYLVAHGGNPGLPGNATNPALVLVAALGNCGDLSSSSTVQLNEVTTTAAAYALAQFASGYDHIGSSATNTVGISNAFANAHLLANPSTGLAATLPANLSTEPAKLYALANALVPCVNSDGSEGCSPLFTAATVNGTAPTDVFGAVLNIVRHPALNVAAVFRAISATSPFPATLTAPPNDWTMSLKVTGGGVAEPTALALDHAGNVWVANYGSQQPAGLAAFSPQGTPLSGSPFGVGLQTESYGVAVDKNNDIWMTSKENVQSNGTGSVAKFHGIGSSTPGALVAQYQNSSFNWPVSAAMDPNGSGTMLFANYVGGTVSIFNLDGTVHSVLGANLSGSQRPFFPVMAVSDGAGGAWVGDQGDSNVDHLLPDGSEVQALCCNSTQTVALDPQGNVWATNYIAVGNDYTFSEISPGGSVLFDKQAVPSLYAPGGAAVDAGGQFWALNYAAVAGTYANFSEIAGNNAGVPAGTPLSSSTGFGRDAQMSVPYAIAPDSSGNLWVTARAQNAVYMFFGLATPTATPAGPTPQLP